MKIPYFLRYFDCDPFELNFRTHVFGGFWPLETNVRWQQIVFSIFSYICFFSVTSMVFLQFLDLYLLRNNVILLTKHLSIISVSVAIVAKSYFYLYRIDLVQELKAKVNEYKDTRTDEVDAEILEQSNRAIAKYMKIFYGIGLPCVLVWIVYPALDSSEKMALLFPYRIPMEEWTWSVYVSLYVYQALSIFGFLLNVSSLDGMFCGFVHRICAHYDIVIKNFKNLDRIDVFNDPNAGQKLKNILVNNVKLHNQILSELKILEKIFSQTTFIHFFLVATATGTMVIDTLVLSRGLRLEIVQRLLLLAVALWDTFLYCWFGRRLSDKSLQLNEAIYSTRWYEMKPAIRKEFWVVIAKTQKPPKIRVNQLFLLDISSFVTFLKSTYDAISFIYQTTKKRHF